MVLLGYMAAVLPTGSVLGVGDGALTALGEHSTAAYHTTLLFASSPDHFLIIGKWVVIFAKMCYAEKILAESSPNSVTNFYQDPAQGESCATVANSLQPALPEQGLLKCDENLEGYLMT